MLNFEVFASSVDNATANRKFYQDELCEAELQPLLKFSKHSLEDLKEAMEDVAEQRKEDQAYIATMHVWSFYTDVTANAEAAAFLGIMCP